jgi:hypothetical protein
VRRREEKDERGLPLLETTEGTCSEDTLGLAEAIRVNNGFFPRERKQGSCTPRKMTQSQVSGRNE